MNQVGDTVAGALYNRNCLEAAFCAKEMEPGFCLKEMEPGAASATVTVKLSEAITCAQPVDTVSLDNKAKHVQYVKQSTRSACSCCTCCQIGIGGFMVWYLAMVNCILFQAVL